MCLCAKLTSVMCNSLWSHGPTGSSVHGIFQARILEWVTMPSSRGSSWPRNWAHSLLWFLYYRQILYHGAIREASAFHIDCPIYNPPNHMQGFSLYSTSTFVIFNLFDNCHSNRCDVAFIFLSLMTSDVDWACNYWPLIYFFLKNVYSALGSFLNYLFICY